MSDVPSHDFDRNKQASYEIQVLTSVAYEPIDDVSLPLDVSVASKVFIAKFIGTFLDSVLYHCNCTFTAHITPVLFIDYIQHVLFIGDHRVVSTDAKVLFSDNTSDDNTSKLQLYCRPVMSFELTG